MSTPQTLAQRIAGGRIGPLQAAIVAQLRPLFPGVAVREHPGRVDVADLLSKELIPAPAILVAPSRVRVPTDLEGGYGLRVDWAAFVAVEDAVIAGRRIERHVVGTAIGGGLLDILRDPTAFRWGESDITDPLDDPAPELRPVMTIQTLERGIALYAVTWSQQLIALGTPFWDMGSAPPPDFTAEALLPGDPGWGEDEPPEEAP